MLTNAPRFETLEPSVPWYVAIYEMEVPEVLYTPEFRALADSGEWPHRIRPYASNHCRVVYKRVVRGG